MELVIISLTAFLAAMLTFFSGFGLGTLLLPVFMLFFPVELAIALTGVVHFLNNIFKIILVGRQADKTVVLRFGLPAVIAALAGAWLLFRIPDTGPLFAYRLSDRYFEAYPVKFFIAFLLFIFAGMELIPYFVKLQFSRKRLSLGGALSGFLGGLSGHQGALRSAFLIKAGLSKEAFIGTAVVVSTLVDFTRLSVYATQFSGTGLTENLTPVGCATLSAVTGAYTGNLLLKKITLGFLQRMVAVMLLLLAVALGAGWL